MDPIWIVNLPASAWSWISGRPAWLWSVFKSETIKADKYLRGFSSEPSYYITATSVGALLGIGALAFVIWGEWIDTKLHTDAGKVLAKTLPKPSEEEQIVSHNRKAKAMRLKAYARVLTACAIIATALGVFWKPQ